MQGQLASAAGVLSHPSRPEHIGSQFEKTLPPSYADACCADADLCYEELCLHICGSCEPCISSRDGSLHYPAAYRVTSSARKV